MAHGRDGDGSDEEVTGVNYEDEPYVRLYTRDTVAWLRLQWQGQAVLALLLRKLDRAGAIEVGESAADAAESVAALLSMPVSVVKVGLSRILAGGALEHAGRFLIMPKFIDAQTASKAPKERQREHRERKRDMLRAGLDPSQRGTVIYFVQSENGGHIKIGRAEDLAKRLIGLASGRPDKLVVLASFPGTIADEKEIHALLAPHRDKGEWFLPNNDVVAAVAFAAQNGRGVIDWLRDKSRPQSHSVTPNVTDSSQVTKQASPVTPSLALHSSAEEEKIPLPPSEPEQSGPPPRDPMGDTLRKQPPGKRADVLRVWEAFKTALAYPPRTKFRGPWDDDARRIADAIDQYDERTCIAIVAEAPRDGMVNGTTDERHQRHDSVHYVFENQDTFRRLLRAAEARKRRDSGIDPVARAAAAEPDLTDYRDPEVA